MLGWLSCCSLQPVLVAFWAKGINFRFKIFTAALFYSALVRKLQFSRVCSSWVQFSSPGSFQFKRLKHGHFDSEFPHVVELMHADWPASNLNEALTSKTVKRRGSIHIYITVWFSSICEMKSIQWWCSKWHHEIPAKLLANTRRENTFDFWVEVMKYLSYVNCLCRWQMGLAKQCSLKLASLECQ